MGQDLSLKVILRAQDQASGALKGFGSTLVNLAGAGGPLLKVLLAISAAVVGFGAASVQMAAQYDQNMRMVQALTGSNAQQMSFYDAQVKKLAIDAGVAPTKLASGLYNVLSASYSGADAMKILTLATQDSKIGMTDAATTSNALTNVLRTFGTATKDATRVNGEMLETVTLGKSTFAQYASSVTKAASSSKQFGVNMETMNAAWSTLTSTGISAGQATTDYSALLRMMNANIGTVSKSLHKNGIAFDETKFNAMSFGDKVQYLNSVLQQATDKHVHITGATVQASQAIQAISGHIDTYNSNLKTLSNSQEMNKKTADAWNTTQAGFNQTMSRVNATVSVFMISIGQALLPVLTKLAASLIPLISRFGDWLTKSGILQKVADGLSTGIGLLGTGIQNTAGFITGLVTDISNVIGWFQKGSPAALALRDALIAVGAAIAIIKLGNLIATIPTLLVQLGAWLAATWAQTAAFIAEAIAEMAANWPIYLIIAAVILLIGIIILLVQHWNQVVAFLQGVWSAFSSWFMNALHAVGAFFVRIWDNIVTSLKNFWNTIVSVAKAGLAFLLNIFTAPFRAIGALFVWLYNHNYYFKMLVDKIRIIFFAVLAWIQVQWKRVVDWLVGLWKNISTWATSAWNTVKDAIVKVMVAVGLWIYDQWTKISGWLSDQWNKFAGLATKAWQAVSGVFSSIWSKYVSGPLGSLWTSISGWFSNLAKTAFDWGKNLITGFINGIKNMAGAVGQAAQNIFSQVGKFLGFHSPAKEGEGRYIIQYGSNMIKGFSTGILNAIPQLQQTVAMAVHTGLQPMSPPALSGSIPYGRPPSGNSYNNSIAGGNTHNGDIVIQGAGMNARQLADEIERRQNAKYRRSGVMGNLSAGGRSS